MNLRLVWTVFLKEAVDNLRDRRSIFNALLSVSLNPIIYIVLFGFLNSIISEQAEQSLPLPVVGADYAPNLIAFLDQNNVDILPAPADPEAALREGEVAVVLVIDPDYAEDFEAGLPATVRVLRDESSQGGTVFVSRTERLLREYAGRIAAQRLLARGISPVVVQPFSIEAMDVSAAAVGVAGTVLNLLPAIMLTAAFLGGFYMTVDMTAGERERESLEPLLINPAPRWAFVVGKYLMSLAFTLFATALATSLFLVLLGIPAIQSFTGLQISVTAAQITLAVLLMLPIIIMAVALQMLVSAWAKNVKEAQTYTQLLSLAGFMPALFLSILPIRAQPWMMSIPTIGQTFLVNRLMRGEVLVTSEVVLATVIALGIGVAAFIGALWLYRSERIILGGEG